MNPSAQTLLAFDYGTRRIGVAVGQDLTRTASPLETITVTRSRPDWEAITRLIAEWRPGSLIVGIPYNDDGSEHVLTRAARRFGHQLQGRYQLPVHTVDERLSSHEAERVARAARGTGKRMKQDIDKIAAQFILQTWLSEGT